MKFLTLLDKVNDALDSKRLENVLSFICFVVAPSYILYHIVFFFFKG
jgi:phosphatidylserine synthase